MILNDFKHSMNETEENVSVYDLQTDEASEVTLLKLNDPDGDLVDVVAIDKFFRIMSVGERSDGKLYFDNNVEPYGILVDDEVEGKCFDMDGYWIEEYESTRKYEGVEDDR